MANNARRRITEAFVITTVLLVLLLGLPALSQQRQADQGKGGTTATQVWLVKVCDSNGANCGTFAIPVTVTGTLPVTVTGTMTVTGTVQNNGGTVTATPTGTTTITGTVSVTSGTIGQLPSISQTSGTVNSATVNQMPSLSVTSGTIGQMPALSFTSGTVGLITMPSLTFTSGTIGSLPAITGTVQATITGTQNVTFTNTAITAHQGNAANGTLGWPSVFGQVTASSASWTSATGLNTALTINTTGLATVIISNNPVTITGGVLTPEVSDDGGTTWYPVAATPTTTINFIPSLTIGPTTVGMYTVPVAGMTNFRLRLSTVLTGAGTDVVRIQASAAPRDAYVALTQAASTLGVNLTALSGAAITTAAPFIDGGRASTDTRAAVADAAVVALRLSKWGDVIIMPAPIDMWATANTGSLTATTVSAVLAAPGAAYRWAVTGWNSCNLSGVVATQINLLDGTTIRDAFPWTQTATTAGEARCYVDTYNPPILFTANSAVNVQLTVSNVTGVRFVVSGYKTGT